MNPLLSQPVLVLWVVTRRGCPLPKENCHYKNPDLAGAAILLLLPPSRFQPRSPPCVLPGVSLMCFEQSLCCCRRPGSNLAVRRASCQVLGPVLGLVEHLCLPVELRRPTRPPRFLPRYHREARRGDLQKTRAITELTDPLGDEV